MTSSTLRVPPCYAWVVRRQVINFRELNRMLRRTKATTSAPDTPKLRNKGKKDMPVDVDALRSETFKRVRSGALYQGIEEMIRPPELDVFP